MRKTSRTHKVGDQDQKVHDPMMSGWAADAHAFDSEDVDEDSTPVQLRAKSVAKVQPEYTVVAAESNDNAPQGLKLPALEGDQDDDDETDALQDAKDDVKDAKVEIRAFKDDATFEKLIDDSADTIANETNSPALGTFLGELRLELREYAKPAYPKYLEKRLKEAQDKVKELEAEKEGKTTTAHPLAAAAKAADDATDATKEGEKKEDEKKEGEKEEGEEKKDNLKKGESVSEVQRKAAETWSVSFFIDVVLLAAVFALANSKNSTVRNYTWVVIDQVIAVFLAVLYFQAFGSMIDFHGLSPHNAIIAHMVNAFFVLGMVLFLAGKLYKNNLGLAILCGSGAHIASFSSIGWAAHQQNSLMGYSYSTAMCLFGMVCLLLGLAIIGYLVYTAKKRAGMLQEDNYMDKTDDVENDFGSMAMSVVWTMFVRFMLTGHHPEDDESDVKNRHTQTERTAMFIYFILTLPVAAGVVAYCGKKQSQVTSYAAKRVLTFVSTVATMNVAWAMLFWGEWEFFDVLFRGEVLKGKVMFAVAASIFCGLALVGLTKVPTGKGFGKKEVLVALTAVSLVTAWSWEGCFDAAVEDMTEGVAHPATWKAVSTATLFAVVLPVYAMYVKPISNEAAEAVGA